MKKTNKVQHRPPELVLTDRKTGDVLRTGLNLIDLHKRETVQRLDCGFIEKMTAYGITLTTEAVEAMHVEHQKAVDRLFASVGEPLHAGYSLYVTYAKRGDRENKVTHETTRQVRETFKTVGYQIMEMGKKVKKKALYQEIKERHGVGLTKAKELTRDIPWPLPPRDSDADDVSIGKSAA